MRQDSALLTPRTTESDCSDDNATDSKDGKDGPEPGISGFIKALTAQPILASLLLFIPFGFLSNLLGWEKWLVFTCNFFSILPMAWLIGKSTEDLSSTMGDTIGGLLNATFGNVVEMLLCIAGIQLEEFSIVQCTLVGSILSNILLVMGTAFIYGGFKNPPTQKYSKMGAGAQTSLMLLSVIGILLPTVYTSLMPGEQALLDISRGSSLLLFCIYVQYLVFQLKTHKDIFESPDDDGGDEDDEDVDMDSCTATIVLAICTVLTAFCSEYLIGSIEGTIESWKVSKEFIGVIILPIIGNAAEHWTAIAMAGANKMDLALGVAVGSSCQMALLVTPFTVLVGWVLDKPMSLNFHAFQVTVLLLSILIVANVLKDGYSNWLEGSMLCTSYMVIAMIYFYEEAGWSSVVQESLD